VDPCSDNGSKKENREKVMVSVFTNDSIWALSVNASPSSQANASNKKVKPLKKQ
jgi:hypothetical protein